MSLKKYLSILTAALLVSSTVLTGCGSSKTDSKTSNSEPVTLNYWVAWTPGSTEEKNSKEQIKKFEEENPNIKINTQLVSFDMMHDKLVVSGSSGNAPDLSWGLSEWFGEFNKMGLLMDLTDKFNSWQDKDVIYPNVMKSLTVDNKVMALPQYLGIRAMIIHKNLLSQAGYDKAPATWDELLKMGATVKEKTGKYVFGIAGKGVRSPQELIAYLASNDVEVATKMDDGLYKNTWNDNPDQLKRAAEVFQFYKDLMDKGVINPDAKSWGWEEEDSNFGMAQYAMVVDGNWIEGQKDRQPEAMSDVDVVAPPSKKTPATFLEVSPLYLYASSKHPEETWKFASYILGKDWQTNIRLTCSPRTDVNSDTVWGKNFTALTNIGVTFPAISLGNVTTNMTDSISKVLIDGQSPEEVAKWLSTEINKSLKDSGQLSSK